MIGRRGIALLALWLACVVAWPRAGRADPAPFLAGDAVALLPLDADRSLELYGQPVASEIARALGAGTIQVVVVGPRMAVPDRARLIIDGTISLGKAGAITIAIRVRNTLDGKVLDTLSATAPGLARLDGAAADLSARILPIVRDRLAALQQPVPAPAGDHGHVTQTATLPAAARTVLVAVADETHRANNAALVAALAPAVADWTRAHHRQLGKLDPGKLEPKLATKAVTAASDFAIGLWVLDYQPELTTGTPGAAVRMARARVRVRIAGPAAILFDRVVVTDTVVGDRGASPEALADRVGREVLAILRPHMLRHVQAWE